MYLSFTNIKEIACGVDHSVALKEDGNIYCWGNNDYNKCDLNYLTFTNIRFSNDFDYLLK